MKRKMVILSLACLMALSGATGVHAEENLPVDESGAVSPLGKYEDPVTVEIVQSINPTLTIPEGDSATDNYYTRYIKDNMNIDISVKWSASSSDYNEKMNLAIAANDIPDILGVNVSSSSGSWLSPICWRILTDYYDTYACDIIKQNIDSTEGKALENATYDGKLLASPERCRWRPTAMCSCGFVRTGWMRWDWKRRPLSRSWRRWRKPSWTTRWAEKTPSVSWVRRSTARFTTPSACHEQPEQSRRYFPGISGLPGLLGAG